MKFPFGKYKDQSIKEVCAIDKDYCIWFSSLPKTKKDPEFKRELEAIILITPDQKEDIRHMPFGKYEGCLIEEFVISDKAYSDWLLKEASFRLEKPKTFAYFKSIYESIHILQSKETMFFYILKSNNIEEIKVGKTQQYIVKRLYDYVSTSNTYSNAIIDVENSYVFKTNDLNIEDKVKDYFNDFRENKRIEKFNLYVDYIDNYLYHKMKENNGYYYYKKCLSDFIPYNTLNELRKDFVIHIDKYQYFKEIYEKHLMSKGLMKNYSPLFLRESMN